MHIRHKRTLAAVAALSTAGAGLMTLSMPANAVSGIDFTITSNNAGSVLIPVDGQGTYFIKNAAVGDVLTFTNTSGPTTPFSAIAQANGAAGTASIAAANAAAAFANVGGVALGAIPINTPTNFTLANYALAGGLAPYGVQGGALDQNVVNSGLSAVVAVADAAPPNSQFAVGLIQFGNQNPNVTTTATATDGHAGGTVTLGGTHFWGSPVLGSNSFMGPLAPTVLLDGTTPLVNTASITAADVTPAGALTVGGVLSGTATLPNNLAAGPHSITVIEPNTTPYDGNGTGPFANQIVASATFNVVGPTAIASPSTAQDGTVVTVTGENFAPNLPASLAFTSGTDTGSATVDANGDLTGTITVNTANEALGSNDVIITQATSGLTATAALNVSAIETLHQTISTSVSPGAGLGDTQSGTTVNMGNTILNGHAQTRSGTLNTVTVTDTRGTNAGWTLTGQLAGDFVNATPGNENGNTTATGVEPNSHNRIPASNLSWIPSVSFDAEDGLAGDVAPGPSTALSKTTAKTLAIAALGGGGGTWKADAALSLKVPAYVNNGVYSAVLDLVLG